MKAFNTIATVLLLFQFSFAEQINKFSSGEILSLVDSCIISQRKIHTISSRIKHTIQIGEYTPQTFEGTVDYKSPNNIFVHYYSPTEEIILANNNSFLFYSVNKKSGYRYMRTGLNPLEKDIDKQLNQIKMNTLEIMRDEYNFSFSSFVGDSDVIISAEPKNGWKNLSKIWLKISIKKKYLASSEFYNKNGILISQNIYYKPFKSKNDNIYFPTQILLKSIQNDVLKIERIRYSRLKINNNFSHEHFSYKLPHDAKIIGSFFDAKK